MLNSQKFWLILNSSVFVLMIVFATLFFGVWEGKILTPQEQSDFLRQVTEVKSK